MSSILGIRMTSLKSVARKGTRFAAIGAAAGFCLAVSSSHATDLRGRVEGRSLEPVTIEVRSPKPPHAPLRKAVTDRNGRFYIADIPPGSYELVVNGVKFPIAVEQVAIQELPPIQLKS